jgi:hypothetical protein
MESSQYNFPNTFKGSVYNGQQRWHGDHGRFITNQQAMECISSSLGVELPTEQLRLDYNESQPTSLTNIDMNSSVVTELLAPTGSRALASVQRPITSDRMVVPGRIEMQPDQLKLVDNNGAPLFNFLTTTSRATEHTSPVSNTVLNRTGSRTSVLADTFPVANLWRDLIEIQPRLHRVQDNKVATASNTLSALKTPLSQSDSHNAPPLLLLNPDNLVIAPIEPIKDHRQSSSINGKETWEGLNDDDLFMSILFKAKPPRAQLVKPKALVVAPGSVKNEFIQTTSVQNHNSQKHRRKLVAAALVGFLVAGALFLQCDSDRTSDNVQRMASVSLEHNEDTVPKTTQPVIETIVPVIIASTLPSVTSPETTVTSIVPIIATTIEVTVPTTIPAEVPSATVPSPSLAPAVRLAIPEIVTPESTEVSIPDPTPQLPVVNRDAWPYLNAHILGVENPYSTIQQTLDMYNQQYGRAFIWNHKDGMFYEGRHIINKSELRDYNKVMQDVFGSSVS